MKIQNKRTMHKKLLITIVLAFLIVMIGSCSSENTVNSPNPVGYSQMSIEFFDNEKELNSAILKAREQSDDDIIGLADIIEYYRPYNSLEGLSIDSINVSHYYVSYWYWDESHNDKATFTWRREDDPKTWKNGIYDFGAASVFELNNNGIEYVFMEFTDTETGKPDGYEVKWIKDSKVFHASILAGYSVEEILDFCNFETVKIE